MSEERKETIFMGAFIALFMVASGWYVLDFLPERDAKLRSIHECYVDSGCEGSGIPGEDQAATECWQDCTVQARNEWENHENGAATK